MEHMSGLRHAAQWLKLLCGRIVGGFRFLRARVTGRAAALARLRPPAREEIESMQSALRELSANVDTLYARTRELEAQQRSTAPRQGGTALNLSTKGQVIKLARNGQSVRSISCTLGLPVGEVELVLKVQRLLKGPAVRAPHASGENEKRAGAIPHERRALDAGQPRTACESITVQ